jgi:indole-3-glycerol phosphate synthase
MARDFLSEILRAKRAEIEKRKISNPLVFDRAEAVSRRSFVEAISRPGINLIAEIKKASPSKGVLKTDLDPFEMAALYEAAGAAAVSVVTDRAFFAGDIDFIGRARAATKAPILRKDFIIDKYQVIESFTAGADALLLIAAALPGAQLARLHAFCEEMQMETVVEVRDRRELERAHDAGARIVGINNRDLATFKADVKTTLDLMPHVGPGRIVVSESGISAPEQIRALAAAGVNAVLIGEALVTARDPRAKARELFHGL